MPEPLTATSERICTTVADTERLAATFAVRLGPGSWVGLIGPLGAGKSVFARAVRRALGVETGMPSPSYTLMSVHQGRMPVYHMDWYRIQSPDELDFAGLAPYFAGNGVCLVEWSARAKAIWPP